MKTNLPESINTQEEAEKFLAELYKNDEHFHPDDDATEIVFNEFTTDEDRIQLNKLMEDIATNVPSFDPCEYILDALEADNKND